MEGKVSLKDLAEHLGVSKTTVSWVLSNQGDSKGISHDTQKRIRDLAAELNYQPNYLARSLNKGTTGTIGLIVPSISDAFYSGIAREIAMEAEHFGYTVMMSSSESDVRREEKMIRMFKMKQVDGITMIIILYGHCHTLSILINLFYILYLFLKNIESLSFAIQMLI